MLGQPDSFPQRPRHKHSGKRQLKTLGPFSGRLGELQNCLAELKINKITLWCVPPKGMDVMLFRCIWVPLRRCCVRTRARRQQIVKHHHTVFLTAVHFTNSVMKDRPHPFLPIPVNWQQCSTYHAHDWSPSCGLMRAVYHSVLLRVHMVTFLHFCLKLTHCLHQKYFRKFRGFPGSTTCFYQGRTKMEKTRRLW